MRCAEQKPIRTALQRTFTLGEALAWAGTLVMLLILGAHFFRAGNSLAVVSIGGLLLFHAGTQAWKTCVVGLALVLGVLEWGMAAQTLAVTRMHMGAPWLRGAAILGTVAALTALAASHTLAKAARQRKIVEAATFTQAAAFIVTFLALYGLRAGRPDVLLLERIFPAWGGIQIFLLSWYAGYIAGKLNTPRTSRKMRTTAWLIFTLVFFGQLGLGLSGVLGSALSGTPHITIPGFILFAPAYRGTFSMMPFLVLAATLLAGSAWCSMLCYFGSIEAVAATRKPVKKAPPFLRATIRYGRISVLLIGLAAAFILRLTGVSTEKTLILVAIFAVCSLVLMLFASRKYTGMVHCTAFCPLGIAVNLLGRLSPWRIRIDTERCDGCGACEKACGYRALDVAHRAKGGAGITCSLCRDCIGACPHKAIFLKCFALPARVSGNVFTVLVVMLHVVFVAAARPL
ncbi:MAG: hypothetical protein DELT_02320 [Desulfovibrio sp.]